MKENTIKENGQITIQISETLSFEDHDNFRGLLDQLQSSGCKKCVIDLNQLSSIDSAGLGMLMIAFETAEKAGLDFLINKPQGQVKRLLEISEFEKVMSINF